MILFPWNAHNIYKKWSNNYNVCLTSKVLSQTEKDNDNHRGVDIYIPISIEMRNMVENGT